MEDKKVTLGGFDAILDTVIPNYKSENDESTDDNLEDIKKNNFDPIAEKLKTNKVDDEEDIEEQNEDKDDEEDIDEEKSTELKEEDDDKKPTKKVKNKTEEVDTEDKTEDSQENNEEQSITSFFDMLAEKLGIEEDTENKPKSVDDLANYFSELITENSKPDYSSDEVQQIDEFVRNGGNLKDYFSIDADLDLENIDIEDESNQKVILKEYLKEKGIANDKISKRISRYEDLGALQDEATDALEELKDIKANQKEQLLANQRKASEEAENRQREYYTAVVDEINGLDNIRGIKVPEKDKKTLLNYIFKPEADGRTKYQKDYAKSFKNLIESAYFTMKGDTLMNAAKQEGSKSATDRFKDSLRNSSVSKKTKVIQSRNEDDTIWSSISKTLRSQD